MDLAYLKSKSLIKRVVNREKDKEKEIALVERLTSNDIQAFNQLYNLYSKRVYGFALGFLRSREDAEGVVQEVFIRVWENRANLRSDLSFSWYIFTIARNLILNMLQHHQYELKYQNDIKADPHPDDNDTEEMIHFRDINDHLMNVIEELPPKRKEIFQLSRIEGLSYQEISEKLNISVKTVEVHISLALKYIRSHFKKILSVTILIYNIIEKSNVFFTLFILGELLCCLYIYLDRIL